MKHKLLTLILLATFASSYLIAEEDHKENPDDLDSGFSMSPDEEGHNHSAEKIDSHEHNEKAQGGHDDHSDEGHGSLDNHSGDERDGHDDHNEGGAELNEAQLAAAGITVEPLQKRSINQSITAPGEVLFNAYKSKKITPRITAQVNKRYKRLGDHVKTGEVLVSLSSVDMAQAQGDLIVADQEWRRVKKLGKKVVSERRYVETQITRQQAYAKVLAFGMTKSQIKLLLKDSDPGKAIGRFNLLASQSGTITHDKFVEGEIVEPGRILFEITNESSMWVEARLTPHISHEINVGNIATVRAGVKDYPAKVTQIHHQLDETTRTIAVRLEVKNEKDDLHPGLFVQAQIQTQENQLALALPKNAILRSSDGDWVVFVEEEPGHFKPQEVEIKGTSGDMAIIDGLEPGIRVVTKGAFFVQSEIAKSGFEVHNH